MNYNSLVCEQPPGLHVHEHVTMQSLIAQDTFRLIPGLISCTGVTGSVGVTCHTHATQMAGLRSPCTCAILHIASVLCTCISMYMYTYMNIYMYLLCEEVEERRYMFMYI